MTDYYPAVAQDAVQCDRDNNLWIRTTTLVRGQPVYDIVDRQRGLINRVQLPPFRTIAGFAPGVVYLAVLDRERLVHLERARIRQ